MAVLGSALSIPIIRSMVIYTRARYVRIQLPTC
jgi:hypothetical protein